MSIIAGLYRCCFRNVKAISKFYFLSGADNHVVLINNTRAYEENKTQLYRRGLERARFKIPLTNYLSERNIAENFGIPATTVHSKIGFQVKVSCLFMVPVDLFGVAIEKVLTWDRIEKKLLCGG